MPSFISILGPRPAPQTIQERCGDGLGLGSVPPVVAAAVTAAVLAALAHHARPASAVPPLFSRTAAFTAPRTPGHWQYVSSIAFSPDGRTLATGMTTGTGNSADVSVSSGETFLWNAATGKRTLTLAGAGDGGEAFSPDGKTLATSGTNGSAYLWRIH
jgi:WD40 repeat protein